MKKHLKNFILISYHLCNGTVILWTMDWTLVNFIIEAGLYSFFLAMVSHKDEFLSRQVFNETAIALKLSIKCYFVISACV